MLDVLIKGLLVLGAVGYLCVSCLFVYKYLPIVLR